MGMMIMKSKVTKKNGEPTRVSSLHASSNIWSCVVG